jgi:transcriptional regulator with XRE-family HTH domain
MKPTKKKQVLAAFGGNLRAARLAAQMTQNGLADAAEMSVAYVSLLERGGRNPPLTTVIQLAGILETTPAALVKEAA